MIVVDLAGTTHEPHDSATVDHGDDGGGTLSSVRLQILPDRREPGGSDPHGAVNLGDHVVDGWEGGLTTVRAQGHTARVELRTSFGGQGGPVVVDDAEQGLGTFLGRFAVQEEGPDAAQVRVLHRGRRAVTAGEILHGRHRPLLDPAGPGAVLDDEHLAMERPGTDELGENAIRLGDVVATGIEPGVDADGLLGRLTGDLSDHGGVGAVSDGVLALPAQAVPGLK